MPARRLDYWAWAFFTIGTTGMVSHFWLESFSRDGVVVRHGGARVRSRLGVSAARPAGGADQPRGQSATSPWHFSMCLGAGTMGVLLAFDKAFHFLPGYVLSNVYAHAHLAAVGWALMMVAGVGYRMLPMVLPSAIPEGKSVYLSAVLLEIGVVGLFITLVLGSGWVPFFALVSAWGVAAFLGHVAWRKRHSRTGPGGASTARLRRLACRAGADLPRAGDDIRRRSGRATAVRGDAACRAPLRGVRLDRLSRADSRRPRVAPSSALCLVWRVREPRSPTAARLTAPDA